MVNEKDNSVRYLAHVLILIANVAWGMMSPVSKDVMLSGTVSPLALSGIRIGGAALLFFLFSFILPAGMECRQKIEKSDWWKLFVCSVLMISANQGLFILGIGFTNPVDSSVMSAMTPIITLILAAIILKFPITWLKGAGVAIGLGGVVLLVTDSAVSETATNPLLGNGLCLAAQVCAAVYYVVFRNFIMRYSPFTMMKWMFFLSVVTYVPFCLPEMAKVDYASLPVEIWLEIGYIICIGTFVSYLIIPFAQKHMRPTALSMYNYFQPVSAAVVAVALGVGDFGWVKCVATLFIFGGVYFVNMSSSGK